MDERGLRSGNQNKYLPALYDCLVAGDEVQVVAERYGVSVGTIYNWLKRAQASPATIAKLQDRVNADEAVEAVLTEALRLRLLNMREFAELNRAHRADWEEFPKHYRRLIEAIQKAKKIVDESH